MGRARHGEYADAVAVLADTLRARRDQLAEQIVTAVSEQSPRLPGEYSPALLQVVTQAIDHFVSAMLDPDPPVDGVYDRFRRIGLAQARVGRSLESLRSDYQLATSIAWKNLRSISLELGLPASLVGEQAVAAFEFLDSLSERSVLGYRQRSEPAGRWRERLLDTILRPDDHPAWLLGQLADAGNWPVPRQVVAVAVQRAPGVPLPAASRLPAAALPDLRRTPVLLLYPAPLAAETRAELAAVFAGHTVAIGCPVGLADAAASLRWARRCLDLVGAGVIDRQPVLDCAEHMAMLWLHAEPSLRQQLSRSVLAPLLRQPPHSRRILAETMLAWLETRASAPVLASRLGKHAQTVRYRLRRLHQIFGSDLDDAQRCFEIYLVLRASMPLWQAGQAIDELERPPSTGRELPA
ncbi:MAG: PucR family transcriptional regulator [Jatrophihabitantaceae bacterium]